MEVQFILVSRLTFCLIKLSILASRPHLDGKILDEMAITALIITFTVLMSNNIKNYKACTMKVLSFYIFRNLSLFQRWNKIFARKV